MSYLGQPVAIQTSGIVPEVPSCPNISDTLAWTQYTTWQTHVAALANFPAGISVLELCAGVGTASMALKLLLGEDKVQSAGAWDLDENLQGIHRAVHGHDAPVHLGQREGNILATDLADFPSASVIVAGPPCPPFSACGKRMALEDSRAAPFQRCLEIISDIAHRPCAGHPGKGTAPQCL